jgi:L-alanine-DL-glutamate epimerase-like enolase superfamily enzyme
VTLSASFERVTLDLADPFRIARGTRERAENVVVRVDDGDRSGVGAATPARYYGETADTVAAVLPALLDAVESVGDPLSLAAVERRLRETVRGNPAARAAVEVACHDLAAKRLDVPLYRLWGLDPSRAPETSFTVGMAAPDRTREKAAAAVEAGFSTLKVKVGTDPGADEARVAAVREAAPDAALRVDANGGWTPKAAVRAAASLAEFGVEFVEQPVAADDPEGLRYVYEHAPLPVAADESCVTSVDVPAVADRADVVVVKVAKCGGLREARRTVHAARAHGLETMVGCMVGTDAALAAACHLAPLVDYADVDGSLLLAADPYEGVDCSGGEVRLADLDRAGTGARRRPE